ncbi:hypothetical protein BSKO_04957 [Bryopsis sp. KO-2023]|nr:hypothetical protein BSKO_04957 [Bryopsis sp. KO-2023]
MWAVWVVVAAGLGCVALLFLSRMSRNIDRRKDGPIKTMIVLGSGGHTTEMMAVVRAMDLSKYTPRCYVVANTDALGATKAMDLERDKGNLECSTIAKIPRSREVGQSFVTSTWTTLASLAHCATLVWREKPKLVLVNGPGTCIPVCLAAYAYRAVGLAQSKIVYFESIARVKSLSLSGKLMYHSRMADCFMVQWPELQSQYPRSEYKGRLF